MAFPLPHTQLFSPGRDVRQLGPSFPDQVDPVPPAVGAWNLNH